MIVVRDTETLKGKKLVATIGFFDGVHLGHRFLIHELKQVAETAGLPSAVITFPEHPRAVLHTDYQPKLLNSFEEKLKHLASTGIDYCIVLDFTLELSRLTAKEFITTVLADRLHVDTLLIGYDHRFGHNREDGFEQYVTYGKACGIRVIKASQYSEGEAAVSSSEIRAAPNINASRADLLKFRTIRLRSDKSLNQSTILYQNISYTLIIIVKHYFTSSFSRL